ncbi:MAG: sensor histidine kinase [Saprospiraceae bacterium]
MGWDLLVFNLLLFSIIEGNGDYLLTEKMGLQKILLELRGELLSTWMLIFGLSIELLPVHIFFFFLSFLNIFYIDSLKREQIKRTLEEEKLKAELKFLKAQINPHFLFNGINSVYHLIDLKPEIAKTTLLNFSNLLRYQLYECNDDLILLEKELDHIKDYIAMEKIRRGEDVQIELTLPEGINQVKIPPLLFTPFIENAFKYVTNERFPYKTRNWRIINNFNLLARV